ncbi:MAG: PA0069 family radical SAM protein [Verrucomicrobia bacterium]|nr:PA0069 family radical SAM protein [Verrucomicrobiota bacterium]
MTQPAPPPLATRGASANPPNRFEKIHVEPDPDCLDLDAPAPRTEFFKDASQTVIAYNDSPDVGFTAGVNPYRGCEHGCVYCYARPFHEYLGFSSGLDFETKIMVKLDAPELLRAELSSPRWQPQVIAMSGVTDAYQPVERKLQITRRCLEVLAEFRNPVGIVTKNHLVTRDADLLCELARHNAAAVFISLTTLDTELRKHLEPRTSPPGARLAAIETLAKAGVPVGVLIAPVIPGLNDHEIPALLEAAAKAGAQFAGHVLLRLPYAVATIFESWLEQHAPLKKDKALNQIRSTRGGELNDARFGSRMRGEGLLAEQVHRLFSVACRKHGFTKRMPELSTASFRRPGGQQLSLFG